MARTKTIEQVRVVKEEGKTKVKKVKLTKKKMDEMLVRYKTIQAQVKELQKQMKELKNPLVDSFEMYSVEKLVLANGVITQTDYTTPELDKEKVLKLLGQEKYNQCMIEKPVRRIDIK